MTAEAATAIKTYSPELMVTPVYTHALITSDDEAVASGERDSCLSRVTAMLPRVHVLVIGPGLGREAGSG